MTRRRRIGSAVAAAALLTGCLGAGVDDATDEPSPRAVAAPTIDDPLAPPTAGTAATGAVPVPRMPSPGRTFVVATTGDDGAPGTLERPMRTIGAATARAVAGDTVVVRAGTYLELGDEANVMFKRVHGRPDAWITLMGYPGERPVIDARRAEPQYVLWRSIGFQQSSYIEVRGLEIAGTATSTRQPTSGIELVESHHIRVVDTVVHDVGGGGVSTIHSNHVEILRNVVYRTSYWNEYQTSGISSFQAQDIGGDETGVPSIRIEGNVVHSVENRVPPAVGQQITDGNCIIVDMHDELGYSGSTLVANNVCVDNGGRGINVLASRRVLVVNNTLSGNLRSPDHDDEGELSAVRATDVTFRNNVVVPSPGRKATLTFENDHVQFERNLVVDGDGGSPDAVFVDATRFDFRLTDAVAAAKAVPRDLAVPVDLYGRPRNDPTPPGALVG